MLLSMAVAHSSGVHHASTMERIAALARRVGRVPAAHVCFLDGAGVQHWNSALLPQAKPGLAPAPNWEAFFGDEPMIIVSDTAAHPQLAGLLPAIRFVARVQIVWADNAVLGAIWLLDSTPRRLSEDQVAGLVDVAELAAEMLAEHPAEALPTQALEQGDVLRLHALLQNATDLVSINDDQGRVQYISPSVTRMLGYQPTDLIGKTSFSFLHPDDIPNIVASFRIATENPGANSPVRMRFRNVHGDWRVLEASSTNMLEDPHVRGVVVNARDVTEQVQAEQSQIESDERYRRLVELLPDVVVVIQEQQIVLVNQTGLRIFGAAHPDELIGKCVTQFIAPAELDLATDRLQQLMHGDELLSAVYHITSLDGQTRLMEMNSIRIRYADTTAILVVARDIGERRAHEQQILFQAKVLTQMGDAVVAIDNAGLITYLNDAAERQYGRSLAEMRGVFLDELYTIEYLHPTDAETTWQAMEMKDAWRGECRQHIHDGRALEIEAVVMALRADDGTRIGMFAVIRDITARKEVEERLQLLESVVVHAHDAVLVTEAETVHWPGPRIWYVNAAFTTITGYTLEEVVGRTPRLLQGPGTDRNTVRQIGAAITSQQPIQVDILNYTKTGHPIWINLSIAPVLDATGRATHFIAIQRDITERKLLEAQLQQAQKLESIGRLAGGIAHDFNNLLTAVGGYTDLAVEAVPDGSTLHADLLEIRNGVDRAAALTRQLLAFAHQQPHAPQILQLNVVIANLEKLLRRLLGADIELHIQLAPDLLPLIADASQIEQVLVNLAVNARDAMADGGSLTISTSVVQRATQDGATLDHTLPPGEYVRVSIADNGCGMSVETQAHAFEPFFTTKPTGRGTGLGLATCYGIIHQHGGIIQIHSCQGQGTTILIDLPTTAAAVEPVQATALYVAALVGNETVLVVDDDLAVRVLAVRVLRDAGYIVLEASNGLEALACMKEDTGDAIRLVLTDITMPELNGRLLVARIAAEYPTVRTLCMSGNPRLIDSPTWQPADRALLAKPFSPAALLLAVRTALDS